jgi:hypothetical protein
LHEEVRIDRLGEAYAMYGLLKKDAIRLTSPNTGSTWLPTLTDQDIACPKCKLGQFVILEWHLKKVTKRKPEPPNVNIAKIRPLCSPVL